MTTLPDNEWLSLIQDVNETLEQIEGRHRQILAGKKRWLEGLKNSPTLSRLSADKLAAVIFKLEELPAKTGDVVIRQNDPGDYFYIVKSGSFTVSRRTGPGAFELLAQLHEGDTFGETALLSGEKRNASIVADSDSALMRLSREDFDTLLKTDLVRQVAHFNADPLIKAGSRFLDVRRVTLGAAKPLNGALVIPIDQLRDRIAEIDMAQHYIVYCQNGNLSETAAFMLSQNGYNVSVLKGGLNGQR